MATLPQIFDYLAKSPQAFVHTVSSANVRSWLNGLRLGLRFAGIEWMPEDYYAAVEARGWIRNSDIEPEDFVVQGLSDSEMIQALIAVEADAYARAEARKSTHS